MTKKLLNPRGYLSWTQVDMWERSPATYIRKYIHGDAGYENNAIRYGKKASQALETGEDGGDIAMEALVALLPHYSKREHEMRAEMKTTKGSVWLLGKLDTFDPHHIRFREYKTGRVKWTQAKADRHRQLRHYATLIWLSHNCVPKEIWLDWVQTEEVGGEVRMTGMIKPFQVFLGVKEVLEYMADVSRIAWEIDQAYREELKKLS